MTTAISSRKSVVAGVLAILALVALVAVVSLLFCRPTTSPHRQVPAHAKSGGENQGQSSNATPYSTVAEPAAEAVPDNEPHLEQTIAGASAHSGRILAMVKKAQPLVVKRSKWLLSNEINRIVDEALSDDKLAAAVGAVQKTSPAPQEQPMAGRPIIVRLPGESVKLLDGLAKRLEQAAYRNGQGEVAEKLRLTLERGGAKDLFTTYVAFSSAKSAEERRTIIESASPEVREAAMLIASEEWSVEDDRQLREIADKLAVDKALNSNHLAGLEGLALAIEMDWVLKNEESLALHVSAFGNAARKLLHSEEAGWRICNLADSHAEKKRYELASSIYRMAYTSPDALTPSAIYAGIGIAKADWEEGRLQGNLPSERHVTSTILREMKDHLVWDDRLEQPCLYVLRSIDCGGSDSIEIKRAYCEFLIHQAGKAELRYKSADILSAELELARRPEDAAKAHEQAAELADTERLRKLHLEAAKQLREKAGIQYGR